MAIETIGLYPITIDVYKKHKESTVYANDNDLNGRGLLITLLKNNTAFDSTGINLKIGFRNAVGEERLYDCELVDATQGQYKVFYPTEMLTGNGGRVVKLEIKAYEGSGALLNYAPMFVYVNASEIPDDAISGSNEASYLKKLTDDVLYVQEQLGSEFVTQEIVNARQGAESLEANITEIKSQVDYRMVKGELVANVLDFGAIGNGIIDDTSSIQSAINSLINGGVVFIPSGTYLLTNTILLKDGITLRGAGKSALSGRPTKLSFKTFNSAEPAIHIVDGSDINIEDLYLKGRDLGSGNEIQLSGGNRRVNLKNVIVNTKTTGKGIGIDGGGYWITSKIDTCNVTGANIGFYISAACTSLALISCYANICTETGYHIQGTYISLISCASDGNLYGYILQNSSQVTFVSCGSENSKRSALVLINAKGTTIIGFRSHLNGKDITTFYPTFIDIRASNNVVVINCRDSSPEVGNTYSAKSSTTDAGQNVLFISNEFDLPIHSSLSARVRIDGALYIGAKKHTYGTAIPTIGTAVVGDIIYNTLPVAGGYAGWICTVAGTPGTWKGFGLIQS